MHVLLSIAVALALIGCTTREAPLTTNQAQAIIVETEEANKSQAAQESLKRTAFGRRLMKEVTGNCHRLHDQFVAGGSHVDCFYVLPTNFTLSLPSIEYHNTHSDMVGKYFSNWCTAVRYLTGKTSKFTRIAREDHYSERTSCTVLK